MSANNGGVMDTLASAANTAAEQVQSTAHSILGTSAEAKAEAGKEQAKHGSTIGSQIDGATNYLSGKSDQAEHKTKEEYHDKKADAQ